MKNLPPLSEEYFNQFKDKPVKIRPFDPKSRVIAAEYIKRLKNVLNNLGVKIIHRGSTALGISGKGDIEIGIYPGYKGWPKVLSILKEQYGEAGCLEENYARFNDKTDGFEIEIIVLKGYEAELDLALSKYLKDRPNLLKEFEELKRKYSYSKREYQKQKDKFFRQIVEIIPDNK